MLPGYVCMDVDSGQLTGLLFFEVIAANPDFLFELEKRNLIWNKFVRRKSPE